MAQIFISYSRVDYSTFVELFIKRLQFAFPDVKIWYDQAEYGLIGGGIWWDDILKAIAASDVFIYILSNDSINSIYCQAEFTEARRLQKRIITIQARDRTELTNGLDDIQLINMKDGVDSPGAISRLVAAVNLRLKEAKKYRYARPLWKPVTSKPKKEQPPTRPDNDPDVDTQPLQKPSAEMEALKISQKALRWQIMLGLAGLLVALLVGIMTVLPWFIDRLEMSSATQTAAAILSTLTPNTLPSIAAQQTTSPNNTDILSTQRVTSSPTSINGTQETNQSSTMPGHCGSEEVQHILNDINAARIGSGSLSPLALNNDLCSMAYDQSLVIANGNFPANNPRLRRASNGDTSVQDWVKVTNFKPYPVDDREQRNLNYAIDIRTYITQLYNYENIIHYLSEQQDDVADIFADPRWREVGIAVVRSTNSAGAAYYNYVFIVGSQPNVIPVIGYIPSSNEHIAVSNFPNYRVTFWLSNENYYKGLDSEVVGQLSYFAIDENSANLDQLKCGEEVVWQPYNLKIQYDVALRGGLKTLFIRVCDTLSRSITLPVTVAVSDALPPIIADFDASPTNGTNPLTVQFTDNSIGSVRKWEWDFNGDFFVDDVSQSPSFTFNQSDTYIVRLTIMDQQGNKDFTEEIVTVTAFSTPVVEPPKGAFTASHVVGIAPLLVDFNADGSSGEIENYIWDFNNDGFSDSNEKQTQYLFEQPGTYTVRLKVAGLGGDNSIMGIILVRPSSEIFADFVNSTTSSSEGYAPLTIQFTDTSTGDVANLEWNFGAGTPPIMSERNVTYTYIMPGTYKVRLKACNIEDVCSIREKTIQVKDPQS